VGVEPLGEGVGAEALLDQPVVHLAHHRRLGLVDHQPLGRALGLGQHAIAVGALPPVDPALSCREQPPAAGPLRDQRPLVLSEDALDLQQQLLLRTRRDDLLEELDDAAGPLQLLQDDHLVGVGARQAVRRRCQQDRDPALGRQVAQPIQRRPVQVGAAAAVVHELPLRRHVVAPLLRGPAPGGQLAGDGLLLLLLARGRPRVERRAGQAPRARRPLVTGAAVRGAARGADGGRSRRTSSIARHTRSFPSRHATRTPRTSPMAAGFVAIAPASASSSLRTPVAGHAP